LRFAAMAHSLPRSCRLSIDSAHLIAVHIRLLDVSARDLKSYILIDNRIRSKTRIGLQLPCSTPEAMRSRAIPRRFESAAGTAMLPANWSRTRAAPVHGGVELCLVGGSSSECWR